MKVQPPSRETPPTGSKLSNPFSGTQEGWITEKRPSMSPDASDGGESEARERAKTDSAVLPSHNPFHLDMIEGRRGYQTRDPPTTLQYINHVSMNY